MPFLRTRRALLAAACVTSLLVAACGGSSTVVSSFNPQRVVASAGEAGGGATVGFAQQIAARYGAQLVTVPGPANGLALGSARVAGTPNGAGDASAPTLTTQVDAMIAAGVTGNTLVVVAAGLGDVVYEANQVFTAAQTEAQALANVRAAATAYGAQVRRLVAAGAQRIAMTGTWNLGRSPWAFATGRGTLLESLSRNFNEQLLITTADLGSNVLYIDAELYINLITGNPAAYSFVNVSSQLCTTVDAGPGIGAYDIATGTRNNQVNAALCTSSTLNPALNPATTLFADRLAFTNQGGAVLGNYGFDRIRLRW